MFKYIFVKFTYQCHKSQSDKTQHFSQVTKFVRQGKQDSCDQQIIWSYIHLYILFTPLFSKGGELGNRTCNGVVSDLVTEYFNNI